MSTSTFVVRTAFGGSKGKKPEGWDDAEKAFKAAKDIQAEQGGAIHFIAIHVPSAHALAYAGEATTHAINLDKYEGARILNESVIVPSMVVVNSKG